MKKKYFWLFAIVLFAAALVFQCKGSGAGPDDSDDPNGHDKPHVPSDGQGGTLLGGDTRRSIVPEAYFAYWAPGIPDGIPKYEKIHTTINASTYGNGTTDASSAINAAIQAAGAAADADNPQVVFLPAGTYKINSPVILDKSYVVLRGEGASTVLRGKPLNYDPGFVIGTHIINFGSTQIVNVTKAANVGDQSIEVANAAAFKAGDILVLDRKPDDNGSRNGKAGGTEWTGRNYWFHRGGSDANPHPGQGPGSNDGYRSIKQYVEIKSISGNTLNLSNRINISFPLNFVPQVWKVGNEITEYSGFENMKFQNVNHWGDNVAPILMNFDSAYCWIKNVESDGSYSRASESDEGAFRGVHIRMKGFRNHVTGCYVHDSSNNWPGGNGYGIDIQGTDGLIDNNIANFLCKPILGTVTGGGNVIAYNYVPNTQIDAHQIQETAIDTSHSSYSHSDLYEGNYAVNISTDSTNGNNGWMVIFRNHAWGYNLAPSTINGPDNGLNIHGWSNEHASIGNVWLTQADKDAGRITARIDSPSSQNNGMVAYRIGTFASLQGNNYDGDNDVSLGPIQPQIMYDNIPDYPAGWAMAKFHMHLDFNYFSNSVLENSNNSVKDLPDSLFLAGKPGYFGAYAWPPVDPYGANHAARVSGLPAKDRYDSKNYLPLP